MACRQSAARAGFTLSNLILYLPYFCNPKSAQELFGQPQFPYQNCLNYSKRIRKSASLAALSSTLPCSRPNVAVVMVIYCKWELAFLGAFRLAIVDRQRAAASRNFAVIRVAGLIDHDGRCMLSRRKDKTCRERG